MFRQLGNSLFAARDYVAGFRLRSAGSVYTVDIIDGDCDGAYAEMKSLIDRVPGLGSALTGLWGPRALRKVCLMDGQVLTFNVDVASCNVSKTPNCTVRFVDGEAEFLMLRQVAAGEELMMCAVTRVYSRGMCFLHESDSDGACSSGVSSVSMCAIDDAIDGFQEALEFRSSMIAQRRLSFRGQAFGLGAL